MLIICQQNLNRIKTRLRTCFASAGHPDVDNLWLYDDDNDDADAEPLGRWPQGKAMKASVATPMRNEHWFATKKTLVFPRSAACSL